MGSVAGYQYGEGCGGNGWISPIQLTVGAHELTSNAWHHGKQSND